MALWNLCVMYAHVIACEYVCVRECDGEKCNLAPATVDREIFVVEKIL